MNIKYYVYLYLDPRKPGKYIYNSLNFDYEPFYVGNGQKNRVIDHIKEALLYNKPQRNNNYYKFFKIKKILNLNLCPYLEIIKTKTKNESNLLERSLIKTIGRNDLNLGPLTNCTDGGNNKFNLSKKTKENISNSLKGNIPWNKGKTGVYNRETRKRIGDALRGKKRGPISKKQKEQISLIHKGKIISKQTRKKLSKALKGRKVWNKGLKGVQVAWNKGKHFPKKIYYFNKNGKNIKVNNLKQYCKRYNLQYACMVQVYKKTGYYKNKSYKGYIKGEKI